MNRIAKINDPDFSDFLDYLVSVRGYSEKTMVSYGEDVADFLLFLSSQGKRKESPDRDTIRTYLLQLNLDEKEKSSIQRRISALRHFYRYLYAFKDGKDNPFEVINIPKKDKKLPEFLTYEEVCQFLDSNKQRTDDLKDRDQAILELLFASGLRCSEIIGLQKEDIDEEKMRVKVTGKGDKQRIVPFTPICRNAMEIYGKGLRVRLLSNQNDDGTFFLSNRGNKLTVRGLEYILQSAACKSGFTLRVHPHMLRHSFATELVTNGADIRTVQELLGHKNIRTTSIYTHVSYTQLKKTYQECFEMNMNISNEHKAVIFDFNGTMFFDEEKHVRSWREFALEKYHREIKDEEFASHIHGFNNKAILEYFTGKKLSEEEVERLSTEKELIYQRMCEEDKDSLHLVDGLTEFLSDLKKHGVFLAIATASRKPNVDWYIRTFHLLDFFRKDDIIYDDGTLTRGKPDPMIYERALKQLNVRKEDTVIFEDSVSGIKSAYASKVRYVVGIRPKGEEDRIEGMKELSYVIHDYHDIPKEILRFLALD